MSEELAPHNDLPTPVIQTIDDVARHLTGLPEDLKVAVRGVETASKTTHPKNYQQHLVAILGRAVIGSRPARRKIHRVPGPP